MKTSQMLRWLSMFATHTTCYTTRSGRHVNFLYASPPKRQSPGGGGFDVGAFHGNFPKVIVWISGSIIVVVI
jgi:hypothetical protein